MDFRTHYQRELDYLLDTGRAFAKGHPQARHLVERSGDPDVERLLEGFAFLSAKIHARVDQAVPEVVHHLAQFLAPQHLAPLPSCTMMQFKPDVQAMQGIQEIPRHTQVWSRPVQGVACRFRTTQAVRLLPLEIVDVQLESFGRQRCKLALELQTNDASLTTLGELGELDLFAHGEPAITTTLVAWLARHCETMEVFDYAHAAGERERPASARTSRLRHARPRIELIGFDASEPLLPWGDKTLASHRLLAEHLTLPQKFRQLRVHGLTGLVLQDARMRIEFELNCAAQLPGQLDPGVLRLHCAPAINLFDCSAEPLSLDALSRPRRLRAAGLGVDQMEVYAARNVTQIPQGRDQPVRVPSFFSFEASTPSAPQYVLERKISPLDSRLDTYLRLVNTPAAGASERDVLSLDLSCTNRLLVTELNIGDIDVSPRGAASTLAFENLTAPTRPGCPALDGQLHWRLMAVNALNRSSLAETSQLQALIDLYNDQGRMKTAQGLANDHMRASLRAVRSEVTTRLLRGAPVRGTCTRIEMDERNMGEGEAYLFGRVLHEVLGAHVSLNSFNETQVELHPSGRQMDWRFCGEARR